MNKKPSLPRQIQAIDLFCGAGGLTYGLRKADINVLAGIDVDPASFARRNRLWDEELNSQGAIPLRRVIPMTVGLRRCLPPIDIPKPTYQR